MGCWRYSGEWDTNGAEPSQSLREQQWAINQPDGREEYLSQNICKHARATNDKFQAAGRLLSPIIQVVKLSEVVNGNEEQSIHEDGKISQSTLASTQRKKTLSDEDHQRNIESRKEAKCNVR